MKNNETKKSFLDDHRIMVVLSLLIAIVIWSIITISIDPEHTQTVLNVPVAFTYDSAKYTSLGLDVVNQPTAKVTVKVTGKRSEVTTLKAEDLLVYPDYSLVKAAGTMELPLVVRLVDSTMADRVTTVTDQTVSVVFDAIEEKEFDVQVQLQDVSIAEGFVLHSRIAAPSRVSVRGPESEIEKIASIVAVVKGNEELQNLSESKIATVTLEPQDSNGNPVTLRYATMDNLLADVNITVYQTAELPLSVNFINVPVGFDLSSLKYTLSSESLTVSGKPSVIQNLDSLSVSDFDLSTFALDKVFQLNVNLPKEVEAKDKLNSVNLTFDVTGLSQKVFSIPASNIRVINLPANINITPTVQRLTNVTLIGPTEVLESLTASSLVAVIDADECQITEGSENLAVSIQVPASSQVFAVGTYSVECVVQAKGQS